MSAYKPKQKKNKLGGVPPNMPPWVRLCMGVLGRGRMGNASGILACIKARHSAVVAYLVACHRDMSVLALPLNPDIYQGEH